MVVLAKEDQKVAISEAFQLGALLYYNASKSSWEMGQKIQELQEEMLRKAGSIMRDGSC